jgi:hypothetical protein
LERLGGNKIGNRKEKQVRCGGDRGKTGMEL